MRKWRLVRDMKVPPGADSRLGKPSSRAAEPTLAQVEWCFVVRKHPKGGYSVILDNGNTVKEEDASYETPFAAAMTVYEGREVNIRVHPECVYHKDD